MDAKTKPTAATDSAVVKAAAWAWYQRGSGALDTAAREYDATRRRGHATPRPSRYKLEAMRLANHNDKAVQPQGRSDDSNSALSDLLDPYEIESISRHLDKLIEHSSVGSAEGFRRRNKDGIFSDDDESVASLSSSSSMMSSFSSRAKRMNVLSMKRMVRGFWLRHAAAVCGTRDGGVVEMGPATARPLPRVGH